MSRKKFGENSYLILVLKNRKKIVLKNKRNDSNTWTKYHFVDMHSYTKRNIVTHAFNLMRIQNIVDW